MKVLIVGAGFAGATHARELATRGHQVQVIDKRDHIGGNAFDEVIDGVRVHRYGPHLFHTNNESVVRWLRQFGDWVEYRHSVRAKLPNDHLTPLPVNLTTLEDVFGEPVPDEAAARTLLAKLAIPIEKPANAEEHLFSTIGRELTEMFFARYTLKMWGVPLSAMDKAVVQRIPLRFDRQNFYFPNDAFQMMPTDGYTGIIQSILDHPNINVTLSTPFEHFISAGFDHVFNSMPIDEYFEFRFGPLPYRSIRFHHTRELDEHADIPVINFTDSGRHTRRTSWEALPGHKISAEGRLFTLEEPCDYVDNDLERYYPVKTASGENEERLTKYKELASTYENMTFIGRCGTYQYLDMHQVINQSLMSAERWHRGLS